MGYVEKRAKLVCQTSAKKMVNSLGTLTFFRLYLVVQNIARTFPNNDTPGFPCETSRGCLPLNKLIGRGDCAKVYPMIKLGEAGSTRVDEFPGRTWSQDRNSLVFMLCCLNFTAVTVEQPSEKTIKVK